MDSSSISMIPAETGPMPTTDQVTEECQRFRILIVGRSGAGKSSLVNTVFKAALDQAGTARINEELTSPHNKHLIIHDSEGYEAGNEEKFDVLEKFITERSKREPMPTEKLHAIWLCIPAPFSGGQIFEAGEENIFKLTSRNKVPIIVVFTKFDLFVEKLNGERGGRDKISLDFAEKKFKEEYSHAFETWTNNIGGRISYNVAAISLPDTLERLVEITMQSVAETLSPSKGVACARSNEDPSNSTQIHLATAQSVDMRAKIAASIKVGEEKYWSAIGSGMGFYGFDLQKCLYAIHSDITTVWNIRDIDEYFVSDEFRLRMAVIVRDLSHGNKRISLMPKKARIGSVSILNRLTGIFRKLPEHIHFLMGYVVDLTLILQAVFQVSLQDRTEGKVTQDCVTEIIYEFHLSEKKKRIHDTIVGAQHLVAKDSMVEQIKSLIEENEMTDNDRQLDQTGPTIPLLLSILRFEQSANGPVVNKIIFRLLRKVLDLPDYGTVVDELADPLHDAEMLIDFILDAIRNDGLSASGIPDVNRRARRLLFKLINKTDVTLKFLSITDVKIGSHHGIGHLARIYQGDYKGQQVALKMLAPSPILRPDSFNKFSCEKDFCRQALAWRSLVHKFVLPLVGIFEEEPLQFLVSPFMSNGTLIEWRKDKPSSVIPDVHRMMLEVAEGLQYIHSEGIVHSDLCGENVLLDSDFHCRIAGFGLARHFDATVGTFTSFSLLNFPAPELLGNCDKCGKSNCNECREDHEASKTSTTKETDICAFGCLYYSIFFDTYPFQEKDEFQIYRLVARGVRPDRLSYPIIEDNIWDIIQKSWLSKPSERPTIEQIVKYLVNVTMEGDARDLIQIPLKSNPSEHLTKAQLGSSLAETYSSPPEASPSLPVIPRTIPPSPPSSTTATSLLGFFPSLLASLNQSTTRGISTVNKVSLGLARQLLDLPEYAIAPSELSTPDVELLLDFLLHLLRNSSDLSNLGVQDAHRKARKLMFKLISIENVIPKSLFISDVKTETHIFTAMISTGGYGRVFRGEHKRRPVALKVVDEGEYNDSLRKDFCREALAWRSLVHRSILPLLGIFEENSELFLVSPLMKNGTLAQWRSKQNRDVVEIHRLILEVAEGIQYLHSGGLVHGDLHGGNILLDSEFHCQITDFGTIQYFESTATRATTIYVKYAAPELFGTCTVCGLPDCDDERHGANMQHRGKSKETDVFSFGGVYYATFFDSIPFHGKNYFQVLQLVMDGARSDRLESPGMDDDTWNLIQSCWEHIPSKRPTIEQIVKSLTPSA